MICPDCEAENRDGANFCDNCGASMTGQITEESRTGEPALYSWMKLDWFMRFAMMAIVGTAAFLFSMSLGEYGYALLFLFLGAIGWALVYYMSTHR